MDYLSKMSSFGTSNFLADEEAEAHEVEWCASISGGQRSVKTKKKHQNVAKRDGKVGSQRKKGQCCSNTKCGSIRVWRSQTTVTIVYQISNEF